MLFKINKKLLYLVYLAVREKLIIRYLMNLTRNALDSILRFEKTGFYIQQNTPFQKIELVLKRRIEEWENTVNLSSLSSMTDLNCQRKGPGKRQ